MKPQVFLTPLLFLYLACTPMKDLAKKNVYTFTIDNVQYQITSINTESGEGINYLTQTNEQGKTELRARDLNQDGYIDLILKGTLSITEANKIYIAGINSAREAGNYKEKVSLRTFEYIIGETLYTIKTYILGPENTTNLFTIYNHPLKQEFILMDANADGTLDSIENGTITLEDANILYKKVLDEGLKSRRIIKLKDTFIVQEDVLLQTASNNLNKKI